MSDQSTHGADAPADTGEVGQGLWAEFAAADSVERFCQAWLAIQCRQIVGVRGGAVLVRGDDGDGSFAPVAVWPDIHRNMQHLSGAAEQALTQRRGVLLPATGDGAAVQRYDIAYPVEVADQPVAVAVLEIGALPKVELQDALRRLHWGIAWLIDLFRRLRVERDQVMNQRLVTVLDMVAAALEAEGFQHAATTFATEFAERLDCDRVAVGFVKGKHARVRALSHSAHFKEEANLVREIAATMDEAIDQESAVVYPVSAGLDVDDDTINRAAKALCESQQLAAVASVPFSVRGHWAGAVTLERGEGKSFSSDEMALCQATVALVGPTLEAARRDDRSLLFKTGDALRDLLARFFGAGHLAWKLVGASLLAVVAFFVIATGDYRVTADAVTEGRVQRAVVAPFGGYVAEATARAGDVLAAGELIALLDDRDLQLERLKWTSQRDQLSRQLREAKAGREMAQIRILEAQLGQTEAQLALVTEQLGRTRIVAPYDGILISGDLSQSLGAPVERGQVLFEIAPLDEYRLVLQVDDRDISRVIAGQTGILTLSALPSQTFDFAVDRITPVATAEEGRNYFRVEATLDAGSERLRPGMNGVAKVHIGERRLIWIWTHGLVDWFRLWVWSWWP
jgi:multidrug resistance efflux pump